MGFELGSVKLQFFGVCTHMRPILNDTDPNPHWGHRVVLVNCSQVVIDQFFPNHREIVPHVSELKIATADLLEPENLPSTARFTLVESGGDFAIWSLTGVTLSVLNASTVQHVTGTTDCLPHLSAFANGTLPPPGPRAKDALTTVGTNCFVDFASGMFDSLISNHAAVATLLVDTEGPPVIAATPFSGSHPIELSPVEIPLRSNAEVSISNIPSDEDSEAEKDVDFLLNFLTCESIPPNATFPTSVSCMKELRTYNLPRAWNWFASAGCSNSNYP